MLDPQDPFGINNPASWGLDRLKIETIEEANVPPRYHDAMLSLSEKASVILLPMDSASGYVGTLFVSFEDSEGERLIASGPSHAVADHLRKEGYTINLTK